MRLLFLGVIAVAKAAAAAAQAQPKWLSSLTGGHTLEKFAVELDLNQVGQSGPNDPFASNKRDRVYLECDFKVALQCSNERNGGNGPLLVITRDRDDAKQKPYRVTVRPRLWAERFEFGPYTADELKAGAPIEYRRDRKGGGHDAISGKLYIVEPRPQQ